MYILTQMVKLYRDPGEQTIAKVTLGDQPPTVAVSLVEDVSVNTCKGIYSWYNCYICLCVCVCVCVCACVCLHVCVCSWSITGIYTYVQW